MIYVRSMVLAFRTLIRLFMFVQCEKEEKIAKGLVHARIPFTGCVICYIIPAADGS